MKKKVVSIVCPCLNEAGVIKKFHHELSNTISKINNYIFEIVHLINLIRNMQLNIVIDR